MQILISSIFSFYKKFPNDTQEFFLNPILQSIKQISLTNSGPLSADSTPKFGLTTSINIVHLILTQFKHPDKETMIKEVFVPYLPVLFHLFSWARNNWSPIAKQLSEIIEACLVESSNCTLTAKLFLVVCHVLETNCVETSVPLIFPKEGTDYMVTQDGECMATHKEVNLMSPEAVIASQDCIVEAFTDIMQHCTNIASEVLILLIQRLGDSNVITSQDNSLLAPEERAALHLKKGASHLLTFALVTSLCETLNPSDLLSDVASICHFAEVMMINSCTNAIEMEDSHRDNIKLCIAILGLCLLTELDSKQKESLNNLLPVLQKVKEQDHLSSTDKETVEDLMIAIATHSSSNFDIEKFSKALQDQSRLLESAYQQKSIPGKNAKSTTPVKRPLIEDITETKTYPKNLATDEKLIE
uniref:TANGO6 HEAT repeat domain-containing protein n=1 Tax=Ciona savignyi TaxID=51511 RepID=H2ZPR3_CIOSA